MNWINFIYLLFVGSSELRQPAFIQIWIVAILNTQYYAISPAGWPPKGLFRLLSFIVYSFIDIFADDLEFPNALADKEVTRPKRGANVTWCQMLSHNFGLKARGWGQLALTGLMFHREWQGTQTITPFNTEEVALTAVQPGSESEDQSSLRRESICIICIMSYPIHPYCWFG